MRKPWRLFVISIISSRGFHQLVKNWRLRDFFLFPNTEFFLVLFSIGGLSMMELSAHRVEKLSNFQAFPGHQTLWILEYFQYRSTHPEVFYEIGVLKNFTKFTGKHLCRRFFLNECFNIGVFLWILQNF